MKKIPIDLEKQVKDLTDIYYDNKSVIAIAKNPINHERTKYLEVKFHFIREAKQLNKSTLFIAVKMSKQLIYLPSHYLDEKCYKSEVVLETDDLKIEAF